MIIESFTGLNHASYPTNAPPESLAKAENADLWVDGAVFQRAGLGVPSSLWKGVVSTGTALEAEFGGGGVATVRSFAPVDTGLRTTPTVTEG